MTGFYEFYIWKQLLSLLFTSISSTFSKYFIPTFFLLMNFMEMSIVYKRIIIFFFFAGCVHFIDHEYAMYNYEHFEIGNHFCEYAGK